jgi:hypothetical protein
MGGHPRRGLTEADIATAQRYAEASAEALARYERKAASDWTLGGASKRGRRLRRPYFGGCSSSGNDGAAFLYARFPFPSPGTRGFLCEPIARRHVS